MLQATGSYTGANVLIVEDEFLVALELEDILTGAGHTVVSIVPDQAAVLLLEKAPEVALVDIKLRDGPSGATIARQLAERFGTIIVYVTANPGQLGQLAETALGVVQKPFSQHVILAAIALAVNGEADNLPPDLYLCFQQRK